MLSQLLILGRGFGGQGGGKETDFSLSTLFLLLVLAGWER